MDCTLLLRKLAWKYAQQAFNNNLNVDFEELMAEANLAYLEALKTYDESQGKITTYIWHCVSGKLKNYLKKEREYHFIPIEEEESSAPFFEKMTKEAEEIAKIVLTAPADLFCMAKEDAQVEIVKDLLNEGWDWTKIYSGFKNLIQIYS